jgi:hypothetical protein
METGARSREKGRAMAQTKDLRQRIDQIIERSEKELLRASRQLADGIDREANRVVPPASEDVERLVDNVFDFAERVVKGQRRMVRDVLKAVNDQMNRAEAAGRQATKRAGQHATTRHHARARHRTTSKNASGRKGTASRPSATRTPTGKAQAKKPGAKKAAVRRTAATTSRLTAPAAGHERAR